MIAQLTPLIRSSKKLCRFRTRCRKVLPLVLLYCSRGIVQMVTQVIPDPDQIKRLVSVVQHRILRHISVLNHLYVYLFLLSRWWSIYLVNLCPTQFGLFKDCWWEHGICTTSIFRNRCKPGKSCSLAHRIYGEHKFWFYGTISWFRVRTLPWI